ncbi:tRNA-i(6)A37 thiotransferase enzyme MiaB [sediment metagenome]|uniref:tRNA-i(6)A37 thiotransferase enzyme MiaB n=1 Tax=sediment metagenome TaxID=749907 RepID=D9PH96_9ZZZZ
MSTKVFLRSFGCQMNEADSELVRGILSQAGFSVTDNEEDADIVLLNTCAVRDHAVRRVEGYVHDLRHRAKERPLLVGILGCIPTHLKEELIHDKNLNIDFIAGPDSYRRLPELINASQTSNDKISDLELSITENYEGINPQREKGINAWVTIMRGCDNFCAYCVVPYTRGRERSKAPQKVLDEVFNAVNSGFPQVTLLGQNVNSYKYIDWDFAKLLTEVSQVPGLRRVRFVAPHPKDFPVKLLEVMKDHRNICRHIHLPLQAGNDRVLKMMNRNYTQEQFRALVAQMRAYFPKLVLTTDIIVGFPTETDAEFEDTFKIMREIEFDSAFIFKYSERQGTLAAKRYKDDVPPDKKTERIVRLNELQKEISLKKKSWAHWRDPRNYSGGPNHGKI